MILPLPNIFEAEYPEVFDCAGPCGRTALPFEENMKRVTRSGKQPFYWRGATVCDDCFPEVLRVRRERMATKRDVKAGAKAPVSLSMEATR
jgi:hypothetical protein